MLKILRLHKVTICLAAYLNECKLTHASDTNFIMQIKQSAHIFVSEYFWNSSSSVSSSLIVIRYLYIYTHSHLNKRKTENGTSSKSKAQSLNEIHHYSKFLNHSLPQHSSVSQFTSVAPCPVTKPPATGSFYFQYLKLPLKHLLCFPLTWQGRDGESPRVF